MKVIFDVEEDFEVHKFVWHIIYLTHITHVEI